MCFVLSAPTPRADYNNLKGNDDTCVQELKPRPWLRVIFCLQFFACMSSAHGENCTCSHPQTGDGTAEKIARNSTCSIFDNKFSCHPCKGGNRCDFHCMLVMRRFRKIASSKAKNHSGSCGFRVFVTFGGVM